MPAIASIANALADSLLPIQQKHSALLKVWEYIPAKGIERTEQEVRDDFREFGEFLQEFISKVPRPSASFVQFVIGTLLTFILFYRSTVQSNNGTAQVLQAVQDSHAGLLASMNEQFKDLSARIDAQEAARKERPVSFVATVKTKARQTIKPGARVVGTIYAGEIVELLEDRGKKLRVRYFDFHAGMEREGWVLKKYMKRLPVK